MTEPLTTTSINGSNCKRDCVPVDSIENSIDLSCPAINFVHVNTNIRDQYMSGKYQGIPEPIAINFVSLLSTLGLKTN